MNYLAIARQKATKSYNFDSHRDMDQYDLWWRINVNLHANRMRQKWGLIPRDLANEITEQLWNRELMVQEIHEHCLRIVGIKVEL